MQTSAAQEEAARLLQDFKRSITKTQQTTDEPNEKFITKNVFINSEARCINSSVIIGDICVDLFKYIVGSCEKISVEVWSNLPKTYWIALIKSLKY